MPGDIYPPDYNTDRGKVRALIPDVEQVDFAGEGVPEYLFSDTHIDAFLAIYSSKPQTIRVLRAGAAALRAVAVSEGLIAKVIRTEDLQTDGAKMTTALLAGAKQLDDQADKEEEDDDWEYGFQVVDYQPSPCDLPYWMHGFPGGRPVGPTVPAAGFGRWL
ncbi:hypothetical protein [Streptomyces sp. 5-10]|uniref:hypothetical protein n=1 Tax=Streptomyces sp. 5-10 TaxID=878925 RepID=UPI00168A4B29|nr:hypothetical protein [Streptomyces sp. 5-10]MBD3004524.1 hypothetical protein [Streptomyces sp. 5-10]